MANRSLTPILPWDQSGDTAYTWYKDTSLVNILPTGKTLAYDEITAYYPVTARTNDGFELRADGDVEFSARIVATQDPDFNSHELYLDTGDNTGTTQQVSRIKIVGFQGSSAYSASTILTKNPSTIEKRMYLQTDSLSVGSGDTGACVSVVAQNCVFADFVITGTGGGWIPTPTLSRHSNQICAEFNANTGETRSATYSLVLKDTDGNSYGAFFILSQGAASNPDPEPPSPPDTGDTGYTWYEDASILNILPTARTLQYDERQAYYPVTAHTIERLELQASGNVDFTYQITENGTDPNFSSHSLWVNTVNNSGETRQESTLTLVGYKGTSAYTVNTYLFKNPESHAFINASPNPLNAPSVASQTDVYLSFTNCSRSVADELTGNTQLAGWVTVRRVNDSTINFSFQANTGGSPRSTYYMAYGRNGENQLVYERIDIYQDASVMGISVIPSRSNLSKEAGSFTVDISSTEDGPFTFSVAAWMTVTNYSPATNHSGTLYVNYYENFNEWDRTGSITVNQQISVSPYTLSASTTISQRATSQDTATLTVTPASTVVNKHSGTTTFEVSYTGLASVPGVIEGEGNMNITSYNYLNGEFVVSYGANDAAVDKRKTFYITANTENGNVLTREVTILQTGVGLPVAPVWRDYVLDLPANGRRYINYTISFDGETVYTGRAYAYPGAQNTTIYFNQLVKNFLSNYINFETGYQTVGNWLGNFTITSPEMGDITSVAFYEDYSYENRPQQNVMSLNNPITHEVPEGGIVPLSFFVTGETGTVQIRTNKRLTD